jgi:formamidopyrimidine-DNA glycosylase
MFARRCISRIYRQNVEHRRLPNAAVLTHAIKDGGSSLRDHRLTDGELGMFQHHFRVYDRAGERCRTEGCKGIIRRIVQNGRSTFYCPVCQK